MDNFIMFGFIMAFMVIIIATIFGIALVLV